MAGVYIDNLRLFIPQYAVSTVLAMLIYIYLGHRYPGKEHTVPRLRRRVSFPSSSFHTPLTYASGEGTGMFLSLSAVIPAYTAALRNYVFSRTLSFDPIYYQVENGFPSTLYGKIKAPYSRPPFFESNTIYQAYRVIFTISAWAGLMLVITPFTYIYVFLPHFQNPYNIVVAIILSIAIFEGILSTIFFRIGVKFTRVALVEALVIIAFTFSILSPSMTWLSGFDFQGRLVIYLILLVLFCAITALISQLRSRRNLFLSSLIFSIISYASFSAVVLYNILTII